MSVLIGQSRASLQRWRANERWQRHAPLLWVLGPALWLVAPLWHITPLSYDHSTHLFKAWHFWTQMLSQGRLRGWSQFWAFGFPSGELVPFGEELWVCLFRVLTLGLLSWTRTYALAFAALLILKALTAYLFTRRYFSASAGVLCSWFSLADPGAMLKGGWRWYGYYGVWTVELSMCFVLLAYVWIENVFEQRRARAVLWAALWFCASLLSHQLALFVFVVTAPVLLLEHALRPDAGALRGSVLAAGALALGAALAAFSFVPFIARSGHAQDLGWLGDSLPVVSRHLFELRTFENLWPPVHALALVGACFALRNRRPGAVFVVSSAALFVFLSSDTLVSDLHLERALPTLLKIETDRMLLVAKLFWFALAGHGLTELWRLSRGAPCLLPRGRRLLGWAVALPLSAALVLPGLSNLYHTQIEKEFVGEPQTPYWHDFKEFFAWSNALERKSGEFYRIAYHLPYGNHLSTLAPVFNQTPMYKVGYTPTQIFAAFPTTDEPELFAALSVKYVLAAYQLQRADLSFERRFGALWLYRFNAYDPHPFHLNGPGQAELLEFSPERIRVRLSGTSSESRLVLHVANYDRWLATLAGRELPIASVPVYGVEYPILMEVPAGDGEIVVTYVYRTAEWLGLAISLAALPAFLGLLWLSRRSDAFERALAWVSSQKRALLATALGLVVLGSAWIGVRTRDRQRLLPANSLFQDLEGPELTLDGATCRRLEPLVFQCGDQRLQAEVVPGRWGIHACMSTESAGDLRLTGNMRLGSFLVARYDARKGASGSIQLAVDGQDLGTAATRDAELRAQSVQFDARAHAGQAASVELSVRGAALGCFDLRRVP